MTSISIIGTGSMGGAIAGLAAKAGADVQIVARDLAKAQELAASVGGSAATTGDAIAGEIVVLAVPFPAIDELLADASAFDGKIVVDITNPVDFATFDGLAVPADSSAAAVIAAKLPQAKVVKAFNTNFAATLASGTVGSATTAVAVAGDDAEAKDAVLALVRAAGLEGIDAGALKRARELEAVGFLQITLAVREQIGWTGGFSLVK